jgi:hypothetical protein
LLALSEPIGQIQHDAGEETRLGNPEQESRHIQLRDAMHRSGEYGYDAPTDQDASNPNTCADLVEQKIAGDFEDEITPKEYPDEQPVLRTRNA